MSVEKVRPSGMNCFIGWRFCSLTPWPPHSATTWLGTMGSSAALRGLSLLLRSQHLADQPDHQQLEQIDQARGEYFDEQLFHDRQVRTPR
jgi:hypothetical protein